MNNTGTMFIGVWDQPYQRPWNRDTSHIFLAIHYLLKYFLHILRVCLEINSHFSNGGTQFGAILSAQKRAHVRVRFFSRN